MEFDATHKAELSFINSFFIALNQIDLIQVETLLCIKYLFSTVQYIFTTTLTDTTYNEIETIYLSIYCTNSN